MKEANDLTFYENFAHEWWEKDSFHFASLQNITPFRMSLIREEVGSFEGLKVLDLGCGGGLLSLPLIREGALLKGIDISPGSIAEAKRVTEGKGEFLSKDIRDYEPEADTYDLILLADVIDHIKEYHQLLDKAFRALKKGGILFVSTINRTFLSKLLAIKVGEGLKLIPPGTHDWNMFVKPKELIDHANNYGLKEFKTVGDWPEIFKSIKNKKISIRKSRFLSLGYAIFFKK